MQFYSKINTGDSSLFEVSISEGVSSLQTTTLTEIVESHVADGDMIKLLKLEAEGAEPEIL